MKYPNIGTVSEATTLSEDLIPSFMSVLEEFDQERATTIELEYKDVFDAMGADDFDRFEGELEEQSSYLVDALFDALQAIAPPYCSFGASEGDGADYGFWPDIESLEEDARISNGVVKVNDGDTFTYDSPSYVLVNGERVKGDNIIYGMSVSDHGNVTLYDLLKQREIWSLV